MENNLLLSKIKDFYEINNKKYSYHIFYNDLMSIDPTKGKFSLIILQLIINGKNSYQDIFNSNLSKNLRQLSYLNQSDYQIDDFATIENVNQLEEKILNIKKEIEDKKILKEKIEYNQMMETFYENNGIEISLIKDIQKFQKKIYLSSSFTQNALSLFNIKNKNANPFESGKHFFIKIKNILSNKYVISIIDKKAYIINEYGERSLKFAQIHWNNIKDFLLELNKKYGNIIEFIPNEYLTKEIIETSGITYKDAIKFANKHPEFQYSYTFYLNSLKLDPNNFLHIPKNIQDDKLSLKAVSKNGIMIKNVSNKTKEICMEAYNNNVDSIKWIPKEYTTKEMWQKALEKDLHNYIMMPDEYKDEKIILSIIARDGRYLKWTPQEKMTSTLCIIAAQNNPYARKWIPNHIKQELEDELNYLKKITF